MTDGLLTTKRVKFLPTQWSEFVRILPIVTARERAWQFVRQSQLTRNCCQKSSFRQEYFRSSVGIEHDVIGDIDHALALA
jgi:hypothetical protein